MIFIQNFIMSLFLILTPSFASEFSSDDPQDGIKYYGNMLVEKRCYQLPLTYGQVRTNFSYKERIYIYFGEHNGFEKDKKSFIAGGAVCCKKTDDKITIDSEASFFKKLNELLDEKSNYSSNISLDFCLRLSGDLQKMDSLLKKLEYKISKFSKVSCFSNEDDKLCDQGNDLIIKYSRKKEQELEKQRDDVRKIASEKGLWIPDHLDPLDPNIQLEIMSYSIEDDHSTDEEDNY